MNLNDENKLNNFLVAAVVIFASLSAYTTMIGIKLIWEDTAFLEKYFFSALFAIGCSVMMIYLTLRLPHLISRKQGWYNLSGYLLIASISIFFNFNAIYHNFSKQSNIIEELRLIQNKVQNLFSHCEDQFRINYNIDKLISKVDSLEAEAQTEEFHNLRPGRGPIHQKIKQNLNLAKAELQSGNLELESVLTPLKTEKLKTDSLSLLAINHKNEKELTEAFEKNSKLYNTIYSELEAHSVNIPKKFERSANISIERTRSPEQSLKTIVNLFFNFDNLPSWQKYAVIISIILGIALDLPIYLALFLIYMSNSTSGEVEKEKTIRTEEKRKILKEFDPFIDFK